MSLGVNLTRDAGQNAETIQNIAVTSASTQCSNIFMQHTGAITISSTTNCYVAFGDNPTATTSGCAVVTAGFPRKFVRKGSKVALLRVSADGVASIEESPY